MGYTAPAQVAFGKTVWTNYDNKKSALEKLPHSHLSNIYWYKRLEQLRSQTSFAEVAFVKNLKNFIEDKYYEILPYHPLIQVEVDALITRKMVDAVTGDITLHGTVIGNVLNVTGFSLGTRNRVNPPTTKSNPKGLCV